MSESTAAALGVAGRSTVVLATDRGSVELPLRIDDVADGTVWAPLHSEGCDLHALGLRHGSTVRVTGGAA
ncbi:MAG: molybdopterin dinucleotide binding domain-containing protein [bacterium]